jgi:hypothetical protein
MASTCLSHATANSSFETGGSSEGTSMSDGVAVDIGLCSVCDRP